MASQSALVDGVRDIARERPQAKAKRAQGAEAPLRVRFTGGTAARLDPANRRDRIWADVLQSLRESKQPAYVEIDPDTGYITSLLLPRQFTVAAIREIEGGDLQVDLEISHARHHLRRNQDGFEPMRAALDTARRTGTPVLVTESLDSSAIIDVRPAQPPRTQRRR